MLGFTFAASASADSAARLRIASSSAASRAASFSSAASLDACDTAPRCEQRGPARAAVFKRLWAHLLCRETRGFLLLLLAQPRGLSVRSRLLRRSRCRRRSSSRSRLLRRSRCRRRRRSRSRLGLSPFSLGRLGSRFCSLRRQPFLLPVHTTAAMASSERRES